jgi:hypothetical protein
LRNHPLVPSMEASMGRRTLTSRLLALPLRRESESGVRKTRLSSSLSFLLTSLNSLLYVARQSNAPDPRRRPQTVRQFPNPHMRTHQQRHPSPSQCPRLRYLLRRVAGRAIDVGVVVVADPLPRRKTQRRWTGMRVRNLICLRSHHLISGNRRWRASRADQPTLWGTL